MHGFAYRLSLLSALLLLNAPANAAQSPEETMASARQYLDAGKPLIAKKALLKLRKQLEKDDSQKAQLADVLMLYGQSAESAETYGEAQDAYSKALQIKKELNADPAELTAKLEKLHEKYRPLDFSSIDTEKKMAEITKSAGAVSQENGSHVSIELTKPFKQSAEEILKDNPEAAQAQAAVQAQTAPAQPAPEKEKSPQLKAVKLDKKVGFEVVQEKDKVKVQNIEGVNLNVGLWVKLKEVVLSTDENDQQPGIDVTAGKLGVVRTVRIGLPAEAIKNVRKGLEILDPFFKPQPAAAATLDANGRPLSSPPAAQDGTQP